MSTVKTYEDFVNEEAEGKMYKQKLRNIAENAQKFMNMIGDDEDLEAWVQDKITIAEHNMEAIVGYKSAAGKGNEPKTVKGDLPTGGMLIDKK